MSHVLFKIFVSFSVCKYICHKTCEDKVSKHTYATPNLTRFQPERGAIGRSPVHRFSRISHTRSGSVFSETLRQSGYLESPLHVHEETLLPRCTILHRTSWCSNKSPVPPRPQPNNVQQNVLLERSSPTSSSPPSINSYFFFKTTRVAQLVRNRKRSERRRERNRCPLNGCILIRAPSIDRRVPRSMRFLDFLEALV